MAQRKAVFAGAWYPAVEGSCREMIEELRRRRAPASSPAGSRIVAAVGPHAGWAFSGTTLAMTVGLMAAHGDRPETIACFGAVHAAAVARPAAWAQGNWETPLGAAPVDEALAREVMRGGDGLVVNDPGAHLREHSIEVQLPFLREAFPEALFLPIAVPPTADAIRLGRLVAETAAALGRRVVALGSTDLTHYGLGNFGWAPAGAGPDAVRWVREENDPPVIRAMEALDGEAVLRQRGERRNVCGAGAVAATIAFAAARGAKRGVLVDYATSLDAEGGAARDDFVTYAGVVFVAE